jgi:hypothetical protein
LMAALSIFRRTPKRFSGTAVVRSRRRAIFLITFRFSATILPYLTIPLKLNYGAAH